MSTHDEYLDNRAGNSGPGNEDHTEDCTCPNCEAERDMPELAHMPTKLGLELEASLRQLKELTPLTNQGVATIRALLRKCYAHGKSDALEAAALPDHNSRRD